MKRRRGQVARDGEEEGVGKMIPTKGRKEGKKEGRKYGTCVEETMKKKKQQQSLKVKIGVGWMMFGV